MAFLEEVSGTILGTNCGTINFFDVIMSCDQDKTGTGLQVAVEC
jgi:hypothetical protein